MKKILLTSLMVLSQLCSFISISEAAEIAQTKVTIAVDGMMKSKSGVT